MNHGLNPECENSCQVPICLGSESLLAPCGKVVEVRRPKFILRGLRRRAAISAKGREFSTTEQRMRLWIVVPFKSLPTSDRWLAGSRGKLEKDASTNNLLLTIYAALTRHQGFICSPKVAQH